MIFCLTLFRFTALYELYRHGIHSSKRGTLSFDKAQRQKRILELIESIKKSKLTVRDYFASHQTPISLPQYYRVKKRYAQQGVAGIEDQRQAGNARKLDPLKVELLRGVLTYNRHLTSESLKHELQEKWEIELDKSRIDQFRRQFDLTRLKIETTEQETAQFAGIEVFSALAHHIGILDCWKKTIQRRLDHVKHTESFDDRDGHSKGDHVYARRRDGTFTARYNRLSKVRKMKFASVTDKIKDKNLSRLSLYHTS